MSNLVFLEASADAQAGAAAGGVGGMAFTVIYLIAICVAFYFLAIRPQKKQQKKLNEIIAALEVGDSVLTTSGFYGVILDIMDEVVIVEFGNNKNCRIPMKKEAIVEVEKPSMEKTADK